jgi:hypothetical protein
MRLERCLFCGRKFETKDLYWDSVIIDEYGDEDNVWLCRECKANEQSTVEEWVAPEGRGF